MSAVETVGRIMADMLNTLGVLLGEDFSATLVIRNRTSPRGHMFMSRDLPDDVRRTLDELEAGPHLNALATSEGITLPPERMS